MGKAMHVKFYLCVIGYFLHPSMHPSLTSIKQESLLESKDTFQLEEQKTLKGGDEVKLVRGISLGCEGVAGKAVTGKNLKGQTEKTGELHFYPRPEVHQINHVRNRKPCKLRLSTPH